MKQWMAIYTKPRNEKKVAERLSKAGIENYLPLKEEKKKWSDRYKIVKEPIISSYVFLKVEEAERHMILQDPAILNFVFWLGKPAVIQEAEIEKLKFYLGETNSTYQISIENFQAGDQVQVDEGKFSGNEGTVVHSTKKVISIALKGLGMVLKLSPVKAKKIIQN